MNTIIIGAGKVGQTIAKYLSEENDNSTDGIFYIGKESPNAEKVDSQTVSFENKIDDELKKIYSDTTNVLNVFVGN